MTTNKPARPGRRVQKMFDGESRTQQSHQKEVNINTIVAKARLGVFPDAAKPGFYGDFTNATDYHEAYNRVIDAQSDFMGLPSEIRKKFDNDPAALLDFLADEKNLEEAIDLGLVDRPEPVQPEPATKTPEQKPEPPKAEPKTPQST